MHGTSDTKFDVPPLVTRPKAATVGVGRQVILRPAVQKRYLELSEPTLHDQRTDIDRVLEAIDDLEVDCSLDLLRRIPKALRAGNFKVTAVIVDKELIDVQPGDTTATRYGVAYDLGTTTVVATLLSSSFSYTDGVDSPACAVAITQWKVPFASTGDRSSPRPCPSWVPPAMQNGTSLPSCAASSCNRSFENSNCHRSLSAMSVPAASEDRRARRDDGSSRATRGPTGGR